MTLTIYFKSRNVVSIDRVINYEVESRGADISGIRLEQQTKEGGTRIIVQSIDLKNIDCITVND